MSDNSGVFSSDQLLEIISFSKNATAIYATENVIIQWANDAMIAFWGKDRSVIGKPLEDAVPELKGQPFKKMLQNVLETGIDEFGKSIPAELHIHGKLQTFYYDFEYRAIKNSMGEGYSVLHTAEDVTEKVLNRRELLKALEQEEIQTKALIESERNLRLIIQQAPVSIAIFRGNEYKVEIVNARALELWGRMEKEVIDKPIFEVMPELRSQGIKELLDHVYQTGEPFAAVELPVKLLRADKLETVYINFVYEALYNSEGIINGLITIGFDVTSQSLARKKIEESDERFRTMVQQAPVGIAIFNGRELVIESINHAMLKLWGKAANVVGKTVADALPELKGQPFFEIMDSVYTTGEIYYGNEVKAIIDYQGVLKEGYFNIVFQPIKNEVGLTTGIMEVAYDVTEQVDARKAIEWAEERLRLAIDSAELATWFTDLKTGEFVPSPRLKEFFGYSREEEMPLSAGIDQIKEEYREIVRSAIEDSITTGVNYHMEYPVIGFNDQKLRWLKAMGKLYSTADNESVNFFGIVIDITESKQDELRKNDFIGMVSHELKTPLTSLKAIIQVLNGKLKNNTDTFVSGALDKANIQVKKMTSMINGFLNISRLESGKILIIKQQFELDGLIREIIEELKLTISSHAVNLLACDPIIVNADRDKIGSVISNLLSNAIKYSPKGTSVEVQCKQAKEFVQVSVKDEGIGIKSSDKEKLFERYYRVEDTSTQHISGFGIGLYLSAEIIHGHNGRIWVESEPGAGSTFYFTLPINP